MLKNTRDPELSLWQSAVDEVVARTKTISQAQDLGSRAVLVRPDTSNEMVTAAALDVTAAEKGADTPSTALPPLAATEDIGHTAVYCSKLARNIVVDTMKADSADLKIDKAELTVKMGVCDPRWAEAALKYAEFLASRKAVSYRTYSNLSDFVIDDVLPARVRVAVVGDWGTGQDEAKEVLAQIARKEPAIVIHLGDIYYSGTDFEVANYFYNIWSKELNLEQVRTFTLCGNHDMFSGGAPFYRLLDQLKQPASYFCLRNEHWQFLAMDTGFNDRVPSGVVPTFLQDTEVAWLEDKVQTAGNRRTILLSHHQLFSAYESIGGGSVNTHLQSQLHAVLPSVSVWLWGHEHTLTIYERYLNVLGRCVGHGAFPVGIGEVKQPQNPQIPIVSGADLGTGDAFVNHGYAIVDLDGASGTISYYQDSDEDNALYTETVEAAVS